MEKPDITMEVNHMETTMNNIHPDTTTPAAETPQPNTASRPEPPRHSSGRRRGALGRVSSDAVDNGFCPGGHYQQAGFAVFGHPGLAQIGGLQGEMGVLRADMQTQISDVDMQRQIDELRVDMQTQINELRIDMQTQFSELRERIVRIETHLGIEAGSE